MKFTFEQRGAESPLVDAIWRTQSEQADEFWSVAVTQWQMVICRQYGKTYFTVRGPETNAYLAPCPENAEFFGINFKHGAFMPKLPNSQLVNVGLDLPDASGKSSPTLTN